MTVHTQVRQLRIKTNRSYINFGVKLPDGSRTTSPRSHSTQIAGSNLPTTAPEEDVKKKKKSKNKKIVE